MIRKRSGQTDGHDCHTIIRPVIDGRIKITPHIQLMCPHEKVPIVYNFYISFSKVGDKSRSEMTKITISNQSKEPCRHDTEWIARFMIIQFGTLGHDDER
jgi:hypothetical protein